MTPIRLLAFAPIVALAALPAAAAQKCSSGQLSQIRAAQKLAAGRVTTAYFKVQGISAPGRDSGPTATQLANTKRAKELGQLMLLTDITEYNTDKVLFDMKNALLSGNNLPVNCPAKTDTGCKVNAGFVKPGTYAVNLCPPFFSGSNEQRVRTMVHESAHIAKRFVNGGEAYCAVYDCRASCGGQGDEAWAMADNWGHFVHCLSGQTPDKADSISGKGGKGGKSGKKPAPAKKKK